MNDISSQSLTDQEVINKKACSNCYHAADEHDNNKCYALDYDGSSYSACKCTQLNFEFKIRVKIPDLSESKNGNSTFKNRKKQFT